MRCRLQVGLALAVLALALTGCESVSGGLPEAGGAGLPEVSLEGYEGVSVIVDEAQGTFIFPMDAYLTSDENARRTTLANELLYGECMASKGFTYEITTSLEPRKEIADRRYGFWDVEEASLIGAAMSYSPEDEIVVGGPSGLAKVPDVSQEERAVSAACSEEVELFPSVSRDAIASEGQDAELLLPGTLMRTAYALALEDERWAVAEHDWQECLKAAGLALDPPDSLGLVWPTTPKDPEESLRSAVKQATCSVETNRVQRLGDIESQYQAALIDQHQAALDQSAEEQRKVLAKVDGVIDELG